MRKAIVPFFVLFVVAAIWSACWFAAASYAGRQVEGFIAAEAGQGRRWACPERHLGGFPFALAVTCREPSFSGEAMGQRIDGRVAGLAATVSLAHPSRIALTLASPFFYTSSDGRTAVDGSWKTLTFDLAPLPAPRSLVLHGTDVVVNGRFPQQGAAGGQAAALDATFVSSSPQPDRTLDFAVAVKGLPMASLDDIVGGGVAPVDATITGTLDHADSGDARTPGQAMEHWRANGGRVAVSNLRLVRQGASVTASGTLGLDSLHRPEGRLDATFVGLEPILARYGIGGNVAALGSLIGTLFGGGHAAKPAVPGGLALPISLRDGRVSVGPITTAVQVSPLY